MTMAGRKNKVIGNNSIGRNKTPSKKSNSTKSEKIAAVPPPPPQKRKTETLNEVNGSVKATVTSEPTVETPVGTPVETPVTPGDIPAETSTDSQQPSVKTVETVEDVAAPVEYTDELFLKFSNHARPFGLPTYPEIALAGMNYFQQEGMICVPLRIISGIVYKFQLREKVPTTGHKMEFICGGVAHNVPLYTWTTKQREKSTRKDGTLLTFQRAGQGIVGDVPAALFDAKMLELKLELIVPTKMQRIKDTQILNGNRFCVIKTPENVNVIPESIPLVNPLTHAVHHVRVNFKGQERYCQRCSEKHVGQCPELKAFYEAKDKKEEMRANNEIETKIYSDSTLRHVDPLGLRSEVCTMSGGGLGQIIQASMDDPNQHDVTVIMGGTNDVKQQNFVSNKVFAENIDISLHKLREAAKEVPDKSFFLVQQMPYYNEPGENFFTSPDTCIRELYIHQKMQEAADSVANIECIDVQYDVDETGHPSNSGTAQILFQLHKHPIMIHDLIWNDNFIVTDKAYSRVESIYRYGCNCCYKYGLDVSHSEHSNQLLCDVCFAEILVTEDRSNGVLQTITESVLAANSINSEYAFPPPKRFRATEGDENNTVNDVNQMDIS